MSLSEFYDGFAGFTMEILYRTVDKRGDGFQGL